MLAVSPLGQVTVPPETVAEEPHATRILASVVTVAPASEAVVEPVPSGLTQRLALTVVPTAGAESVESVPVALKASPTGLPLESRSLMRNWPSALYPTTLALMSADEIEW